MNIKPFLQPVLEKFAGPRAEPLGPNILAGLTLWGVLVPEGLAYAGMAGMPLQAGLYTLMASLPLYFLFGKSPVLVCAATSAESILMAAIIAPLAGADPARYAVLASLLVLSTGVIFLAAGLFRIGRVTSFLSKPVMTGLIFGLAIYIAVSQLPKILGLARGHGNTLAQLWHLASSLGHINPVTLGVGGLALALIFIFERIAPRLPASLIIMALGISGSRVFDLAGRHGVATVHSFPPGLPGLALPRLGLTDLEALAPAAVGLALVAFSQALGAIESHPGKPGQPVDADRELTALGLANIGSSLFGGLLAGGSMSSTAVNVAAGARSQVSTLVTALMVALTLCFFAPILHGLPEAILGAVVIHAVFRLMKVSEMKRFYALNVNDFALSMIALCGVVLLDILPGLVIAVFASLLRLVIYASNVNIAVLGEVRNDFTIWVDTNLNGNAREIPGLRILRLERPLYFANAAKVHAKITESWQNARDIKAVALMLPANMRLCVTSVDMLRALAAQLRRSSLTLAFIDPAPDVLAILRKAGVIALIGEEHVYRGIEEAVAALGRKIPGDDR